MAHALLWVRRMSFLRSLWRWLLCVPALAGVLSASVAWGQPAAETPAAPAAEAAPPAPADAGDPAWPQRYAGARASLLAGHFAECQAWFSQLAATAPNAIDRALAQTQGELCARWLREGWVLQRHTDGEPSTSASRDRRTIDELAILYGNAVAYGVLSGVALAAFTEPGTAAGGILPALALAGGAAGLVYAIDAKVGLRYGSAQAISSGLYIGLEEGLAWTLWNQARSDRADEWSDKALAAVLWGTATVGAVAGGVLGQTVGTTPGQASFMGSAALWSGTVAGLTVGALTGLDEDVDEYALLAGALALNAGAVGGALLAPNVSPSIARVRFLDLGAVAGALVAGGLYIAVADSDSTAGAAAGTVAAGITGGLAAAWWLTSGMQPDRPAFRGEASAWSSARLSLQPVSGAGRLTGVTLGVQGAL